VIKWFDDHLNRLEPLGYIMTVKAEKIPSKGSDNESQEKENYASRMAVQAHRVVTQRNDCTIESDAGTPTRDGTSQMGPRKT
jgi:hypothetical protein